MNVSKALQAACGFALLAGSVAHAGEASGEPYDWSGITAGIIGSYNTGSDAWNEAGWVSYPLEDAGLVGVFAGYDRQFSDIVLGGRISAQFGSMNEATDLYHEEYSRFYDFNGRVGYATDHLLVYATAGYSVYEHWDDDTSYMPRGHNIGLGAQYAIQDNVLIGMEYLHRELDTDCPHGMGFRHDIDSMQVTVGYKF